MSVSDIQFGSVRQTIDLARRLDRPIFVSCDRRAGRFNGVALPAPMIPAEVAPEPIDGKLRVQFHGPPSFYYLHTDRSWFNQARRLLLDPLQKQTATAFAPPLLVTTDVVNMEIMDVRLPRLLHSQRRSSTTGFFYSKVRPSGFRSSLIRGRLLRTSAPLRRARAAPPSRPRRGFPASARLRTGRDRDRRCRRPWRSGAT
jgi:hypothetical protein